MDMTGKVVFTLLVNSCLVQKDMKAREQKLFGGA